jgi:hypothetical protein
MPFTPGAPPFRPPDNSWVFDTPLTPTPAPWAPFERAVCDCNLCKPPPEPELPLPETNPEVFRPSSQTTTGTRPKRHNFEPVRGQPNIFDDWRRGKGLPDGYPYARR